MGTAGWEDGVRAGMGTAGQEKRVRVRMGTAGQGEGRDGDSGDRGSGQGWGRGEGRDGDGGSGQERRRRQRSPCSTRHIGAIAELPAVPTFIPACIQSSHAGGGDGNSTCMGGGTGGTHTK